MILQSDTGERADNSKEEFPFWCQIAGTGEDGYLEILIMSQDLDVKEFVDKYGRTAFMWAARHGKICKIIIKRIFIFRQKLKLSEF